jgi:hypothetical protein
MKKVVILLANRMMRREVKEIGGMKKLINIEKNTYNMEKKHKNKRHWDFPVPFVACLL